MEGDANLALKWLEKHGGEEWKEKNPATQNNTQINISLSDAFKELAADPLNKMFLKELSFNSL